MHCCAIHIVKFLTSFMYMLAYLRSDVIHAHRQYFRTSYPEFDKVGFDSVTKDSNGIVKYVAHFSR